MNKVNLFKRTTHFFGRKATDVALSPDTMSGGMFSCLVTALSDGLSLLKVTISLYSFFIHTLGDTMRLCVSFFSSAYVCVCMHAYGGQNLTSSSIVLHLIYWVRASHLNPGLTGLTNIASHLVPRISCLCLSGNCHWVPTPVQHLHVFWKSELQSSHLYDKYFFQWAIS